MKGSGANHYPRAPAVSENGKKAFVHGVRAEFIARALCSPILPVGKKEGFEHNKYPEVLKNIMHFSIFTQLIAQII